MLPKNWDKEFEKEIYTEWKEKRVYAFKFRKNKKIYSIDTPPPYVNTPVHIGHIVSYTFMDMFARYRRMRGYAVLFPLGLDRNGLPIERAAEEAFNVRLYELPRSKALEFCKKILEAASLESVDSFLRTGISFNSWEIGTDIGQIYLTDSPSYRALTQETFIDLYERGLIYEENRITNWCPGCRTAIADAEVEYAEDEATWNYIIFEVKETGEKLIIGTTRPELVCTCAMVIFNPGDERYKHLEGKMAITPIYRKEVPIKSNPIADPTKGTGLVMMCSMGDLSDVRFFREQGLKPVIAITKEGKMNENAGFLNGLSVVEAKKAIIEKLKTEGLLVNQSKAKHRIPICERSKDPIEFIEMKEFYLKQIEFKQELLKLAHELNFYHPHSRKILIDWINSIAIDWPISRRRFYATEIPIWYCRNCGYALLAKRGEYVRPWLEPAPAKSCPKCGGEEFIGEERVFDTWFDSSITPLYILNWRRREEFFERAMSCTLRPQGKDIIRTWLYYTLLKCWLLTGKLIFKDVWINNMIVDTYGKKMSKSEGNIIDPKDLLNRFGAEPLRLWAATEGDLTTTDFKCSFEKINGEGKTINKLWNIARFVSSFEKAAKTKPLPLDKWILYELNQLVKIANECYEKYDFHKPAIKIKNFIWQTLASNYLELVKNRAYNSEGKFTQEEQAAAIFTLYSVLDVLLRLLAPIIPFVTYKLYKEIFGKDVHFTKFPKVKKVKTKILTSLLFEINSRIWKAKKERGLSLKAAISKALLPKALKSIENDLSAAHNIKEIEFGSLEDFKIEF